MQLSMGLIWIGALLVIVGVVSLAAKVLEQGRLSQARSARSGTRSDTLEPRHASARFDPKAIWPGLALAILGAFLLLAGALDWIPGT